LKFVVFFYIGDYFFQARKARFDDLDRAERLYRKSATLGDSFAYDDLMSMALAAGDVETAEKIFAGAGGAGKDLEFRYSDQNWKQYLQFTKLDKPFRTAEINPASPPGFCVYTANWLDPDTLLLGYKTIPNDHPAANANRQIKLFRYDLTTGSTSPLFAGIEDEKALPFSSRTKTLNDRNIVFQENSRLIILEKGTFKVLKEFTVPGDGKGFDLSPDGSSLVYSDAEGLYLTDLNRSYSRLILASRKGKRDIDVQRPIWPQWSADGQKILYVLGGWEWTYGIGVISPDGTANRFYEFGDAVLAKWFNDSRRIALGQAPPGSDNPVFSSVILDTTTGETTKLNRDGNSFYPGPDPSGSRVAYISQLGLGEAVFVANLTKGVHYPASGRLGAKFFDWAPSGDRLLIGLGLDNSGELIRILLVHIFKPIAPK